MNTSENNMEMMTMGLLAAKKLSRFLCYHIDRSIYANRNPLRIFFLFSFDLNHLTSVE